MLIRKIVRCVEAHDIMVAHEVVRQRIFWSDRARDGNYDGTHQDKIKEKLINRGKEKKRFTFYAKSDSDSDR